MSPVDEAGQPARRRFLMAAAALLAPCTAQATVYREIGWNELVPPGWDPNQGLRELPPEIDKLDDADPRAKALIDKLRVAWDQAPLVEKLQGADVRLPGYMVPLKAGKSGVREFLLVPFFGACIHSPPPPANQIVRCVSAQPVAGLRLMEGIWAQGRLSAKRHATPMGVAGYTMRLASAQKQG